MSCESPSLESVIEIVSKAGKANEDGWAYLIGLRVEDTVMIEDMSKGVRLEWILFPLLKETD